MKTERSTKLLILIVSILIPAVVAALYIIPKNQETARALDFLPALNATLNGCTSLLLIAAYVMIRNKQISWHKRLMTTALGLSIMFLISYIFYHATHESVKYGATDWTAPVYYFLLLTHILLAIVIVPFVLITFVRAWAQKFDKHRKIARYTLPLWLYVTASGVLVYLMISPYYPS